MSPAVKSPNLPSQPSFLIESSMVKSDSAHRNLPGDVSLSGENGASAPGEHGVDNQDGMDHSSFLAAQSYWTQSPFRAEHKRSPHYLYPPVPSSVNDAGRQRMPIKNEPIWKRCLFLVKRHAKFVGPGLVSSVAYFDPGNWTVGLEAGAQYGYKLLFIMLMAGLGAAVLQTLSLRLGLATSESLPRQIRRLFLRMHDHPRVKPYRWRRWAIMGGLWTLYGLAELAIIATDLAELLGSAIALNLLFPKLPLYAGVLITAIDVLVVLVFFQHPDKGRKGMMAFEILIVTLVLCVFGCFISLLVQANPNWGDVFLGYVPSKTVFGPGALYISVGIIGATVMPHALFLGSHLSTIDRMDIAPRAPPERGSLTYAAFLRRTKVFPNLPRKELLKSLVQRRRNAGQTAASQSGQEEDAGGYDTNGSYRDSSDRYEEEEEEKWEKERARYEAEVKAFDRVSFVDLSIRHATFDTVVSLILVAVAINSAILIVSAAQFHFSSDESTRDAAAEADLFSAYALIQKSIGSAAAFLFAFALLCSGQSASITATLAGQVVSEGFIEWKTSPVVRRMITRSISIIPSVVVAAAVGRSGISTMLVASQVLLSVVLPFVVFPLVWLCSDKNVMEVRNHTPAEDVGESLRQSGSGEGRVECNAVAAGGVDAIQPVPGVAEGSSEVPDSKKDDGQPETVPTLTNEDTSTPAVVKLFTSPKVVTIIGYLIFALVVLANSYVLVTLAMGK